MCNFALQKKKNFFSKIRIILHFVNDFTTENSADKECWVNIVKLVLRYEPNVDPMLIANLQYEINFTIENTI